MVLLYKKKKWKFKIKLDILASIDTIIENITNFLGSHRGPHSVVLVLKGNFLKPCVTQSVKQIILTPPFYIDIFLIIYSSRFLQKSVQSVRSVFATGLLSFH